jgi:hypothetical protein
MTFFYLIAIFAALVASFVAGALYGRRAERAVSAEARAILDAADKRLE